MYLETGYIGLILFFGLFLVLFLLARKSNKSGYADPNHCQIAMTTAIMCMLICIYNSSLRSDSVYMVSFILALPFIKREEAEKSPLEG